MTRRADRVIPMLARARSFQARLLPHGLPDVLRQVALFAIAYYGYRLARGAVDGRAASAFEHGRDLIGIERGMHVFVEPAVQAWASGSGVIIDTASWIYINAQVTITVAA